MKKDSIEYRIILLWAIFHAVALLFVSEFEVFSELSSSDFLIAGLQAIAAAVSIVFALSIITVEHSASNYSHTVIDFFKRDFLVWFTAGYGIFTIGLFGYALLFNQEIVKICFIFFIWNIVLLGIYLRYSLNFMKPSFYINKIPISKEFSKIRKKVIQIAKNKKNTLKQFKIEEEAFGHPHFLSMALNENPELLEDIKKYEQIVYAITLNAFEKKDFETATKGLSIYSKITRQYIHLNPDYEWNENEFFQYIRERLKTFAKYAMDDKNDNTFLEKVLNECISISKQLVEIRTHETSTSYIEPLAIFVLTISEDVGKGSLSKLNLEGVDKTIKTLGEIGVISVKKTKKDHQTTQKILDIGELVKKDAFLSVRCIFQAFRIFFERAKLPTSEYDMLDSDFKKFTEYASYVYSNVGGSGMVGNALFFEGSDINPLIYVNNAIESHNSSFFLDNKRRREDEIHFEKIHRVKSLKRHISLIVGTVGRISHHGSKGMLVKIGISYLRNKKIFKDTIFSHKEEIKKIIENLGNESENIAEMIIISIENKYDEEAIFGIKQIFSFAQNNSKDRQTLEAQKMMRDLNIVGCYLLQFKQKRFKTLLNLVISKIIAFDNYFEEAYSHSNKSRNANNGLGLNEPTWSSPYGGFRYRNLNHKFIENTLSLKNRKKLNSKIKKQKTKLD